LTHGLLAKNVVIDKGEGKERVEDFLVILTELRRELQPENVIQEMLVERIAVAYWRLHRVILAEKGFLRQELDFNSREAAELHELMRKSTVDMENGQLMVYDAPGIEELEMKRARVVNKLEDEDDQSNVGQPRIDRTDLEAQKSALDIALRMKYGELKKLEEQRLLSRKIPMSGQIDSIIRYETALERQFYRALNQFMCLKFGFVSQNNELDHTAGK